MRGGGEGHNLTDKLVWGGKGVSGKASWMKGHLNLYPKDE